MKSRRLPRASATIRPLALMTLLNASAPFSPMLPPISSAFPTFFCALTYFLLDCAVPGKLLGDTKPYGQTKSQSE